MHIVVVGTGGADTISEFSPRARLHIGNHTLPVSFVDNVLPQANLELLREGMLKATYDEGNVDSSSTGQNVGDDFQQAYTFEVTATLAGLPFLAATLRLPVDPFLDHAVDPACNAFFMNAVVLDSRRSVADHPYQSFAIKSHHDGTLNDYADDLELPEDGNARTVVVLYLDDQVDAGGELEIYNATDADPDLDKVATRAAERSCSQSVSGEALLRCQRLAVDQVFSKATLGRVSPRKGRVAHFDGRYSHAVRRMRPKGKHIVRVSLVLEQFSYPDEVIQNVPTLKSRRKHKPFYGSFSLKKRFKNGDLRGRAKVNHTTFQECLNHKRSIAVQNTSPNIVRACVLQASDRQVDHEDL